MNSMREDDIIKTPVCGNTAALSLLREKRIKEALAFPSGTPGRQRKRVIAKLPSGKQVYFLKPGKEAERQNRPNVNDMLPCVGGFTDTNAPTFELIWEHLVKIAIVSPILFKKVLVLLYRNCYFLDHEEAGSGRVRYAPSPALADYIGKIDFALKCGFKDKFKKDVTGLLEYLHFIDLLGWNEDVKYHASGGTSAVRYSDNKNKGRTNTIISVISVPLMINDFLSNIMENVERKEKINVRLILSTMQQLSKSRGICVLSSVKLLEYLSPHLTKK